MKIDVCPKKEVDCDCIVIGCFENSTIDFDLPDSVLREISKINRPGELRQVSLINSAGALPANNIVLLGLGKKEEYSPIIARRLAGHVVRFLRDFQAQKSIAFFMPSFVKDDNSVLSFVVEGAILGSYQFLKYKTVEIDKIRKVDSLTFIGENIDSEVMEGRIIAESSAVIRDVINEPPSVYNPAALADEAKKLEGLGVNVTIMNKQQIIDKGMSALLAVSRGSINEPRFVIMEYKGGPKKVALVGKGITFDSGGLNIKPGESMLTMKMDMGGAGTVIGIMHAVAKLKLPVTVVGVIACTENMPGSDAYKPGDILESYSGKTIEVLNTDAEGRIILADALTYAEKDVQPDVIIDFATLTGAALVALGDVCAAVLGDDEVVNPLLESAGKTGDKLWSLPLWPEYREHVRSDLADVKNLGKKRQAGTISAAAFLKVFVEKTPWAHIDIAGTAWSDEDKDHLSKGGTGYGVRLLTDFLKRYTVEE